MYEFFLKIFDSIFPQSEESRTVRGLTPRQVDSLLTVHRVDKVIVLSSYADPRIRALIHEAKFHGNTHAFQVLHILFMSYFEQHGNNIDTIIPIPLSSIRMRARGFNQVYKILHAPSQKSSNIPIDTGTLTRIHDTRPQTELSRSERLKNMHNAFTVVHPERITGKHILLVDDVTTTGATLRAAHNALVPHAPASLTLLALAH